MILLFYNSSCKDTLRYDDNKRKKNDVDIDARSLQDLSHNIPNCKYTEKTIIWKVLSRIGFVWSFRINRYLFTICLYHINYILKWAKKTVHVMYKECLFLFFLIP